MESSREYQMGETTNSIYLYNHTCDYLNLMRPTSAELSFDRETGLEDTCDMPDSEAELIGKYYS